MILINAINQNWLFCIVDCSVTYFRYTFLGCLYIGIIVIFIVTIVIVIVIPSLKLAIMFVFCSVLFWNYSVVPTLRRFSNSDDESS